MIEVKLDRKTLPKDGQKVKWITHEDMPKCNWKQGQFCSGDDFFIVSSSHWDSSYDVAYWRALDSEETQQTGKECNCDNPYTTLKKFPLCANCGSLLGRT